MEAKATAFAMAADGIHESDAELAWQGTQQLEKMRP